MTVRHHSPVMNRKREPHAHLLATVAHEVRQPLTPMLLALRQLRRAPSVATVEETCKLIEKEIERIVFVTGDLLESARKGRPELRLRHKRCDLRRVVAQVVETIRPMASRRKQQLDIRVPSNSIWLYTDAERLHQILSNLLTNAIKHTPMGRRIWIGVAQHDNKVALTVGDSGNGIPTSALPHVFKMFSRAPKTRAAGHGVGLSVVKRLAEALGGTVAAFSRRGAGCRFVVTLPYTNSAVEA
jgi:signal transduction histidine kinase